MKTNIIANNTNMRTYINYLFAVLMLLGTSAQAWANTIILPAGNSTYTRGAWKNAGAPSSYSSTSSKCYIQTGGANPMPVTFTNASDNYNSDWANTGWLQLKKSSEGSISMVINSTSGVNVSVKYASESTFTMTLTGSASAASGIAANLSGSFTGSESFSTATINTLSTTATLDITAGSNVLYISTITIEARNSGTITIVYNITYDTDGSTGCSVDGPATAAAGSTVNFTITPGTGYFSDGTLVYDDSYEIINELLDPGVSSFTMPTGDVNVYAYFASCVSRTLSATNSSTQVLEVGDTYKRSSWLSVSPNVTGGTPSFRSSNTSVATVAADGTVTAVAAGNADIYVKLGETTVSETTYCETNEVSYPVRVCGKISDKKFTLYKSSPTWSAERGWTITVHSTSYITNAVTYKYSLLRYNESTGEYDIDAGDSYPLSTPATYESGGNYYYYSYISIPCYNLQEGYTYAFETWGVNSCGTESQHTRIGDMVVSCVTPSTPDITVTDVTANSASVSWSATTATTGGISSTIKYDVLITYVDDNSVTQTAYSQTNSTTTSKEFASGLITGKTYTVTVTARNDCGGESNASTTFRPAVYTDYVFSCAELNLTKPDAGDLVFITSTANQTVRSQERFHVTGSGLTPGETVTFSFGNDALNEVFRFKKADGTAPTVSTPGGTIDEDIYVFYTPAAGSTTDGLDQATNLTATVSGAKPKTATLNTKTIIGRHLPENFVIACKFADNQWYALPANQDNGNLPPVQIRVDDATSPTVAYCANTNSFTLYQDNTNNSPKVILGLTNYKNGSNVSYALFGSSSGSEIGKSTGTVTGSPGDQYKWTLAQQATSISGIGDVKYQITVSNNAKPLALRTYSGSTTWGLHAASGTRVTEMRLLPLSEMQPMALTVEEWGTNAIAVSYPNGGNASGLQAIIGDGEPMNVTLTNIGGDIYSIGTITGLSSNPAKTLTITGTESAVTKQVIFTIPLIVTGEETEAKLCSYAAGGTGANLITEGRAIVKYVDIVIRNGGSLTTGTGSGDFKDLYIYPGGKANISNTFKTKNIYLRGGYSWLSGRSGESSYLHPQMLVGNAVSLTVSNVYYDLYLTGDQWYLMALPKDVAMSNVRNENGDAPTTSNAWVATYSGRGRTQKPRQPGWTDQEDFASLTFSRGVGYEIAADPVKSGRIFSTLRFPLQTSWSAEANCSPTVNSWGVTSYEAGTLTANHIGWNLIGNPFYTAYQTSGTGIVAWGYKQHLENGVWTGAYDFDEDEVKYYTIPNKTDYGYEDSRAASTKLDAFFPFYVQVKLENEDDATLSFSASTDRTIKAPASYRTKQQNRELIIDYTLSNDERTCTSGLNISNDYSVEFDMEDKEASITSGVNEIKVYTLVGDIRAAFNSLPDDAIGAIPMGYKTTLAGTHFIALKESSDLKYLQSAIIVDHEAGDYEWDLLQGAYEFETAVQASGNDTRFTLHLSLKQEDETATNINNIGWMDDIFAIGYPGKIVVHGIPIGANLWAYDMTGKLVGLRRNITEEYMEISALPQGVYHIRVTTDQGAQTLKVVVK